MTVLCAVTVLSTKLSDFRNARAESSGETPEKL